MECAFDGFVCNRMLYYKVLYFQSFLFILRAQFKVNQYRRPWGTITYKSILPSYDNRVSAAQKRREIKTSGGTEMRLQFEP